MKIINAVFYMLILTPTSVLAVKTQRQRGGSAKRQLRMGRMGSSKGGSSKSGSSKSGSSKSSKSGSSKSSKSGGGGPADSCTKQAECIDITTETITSGLTCGSGGCEYEICLKIVSGGSCVQSGSWSHSCVKPSDTCQVDGGFSGAVETSSGVTADFEQCQIVAVGGTAEFLLKDGSKCKDSASLGDASCEPRPSSIDSCTGDGLGKECVWTIAAPVDCDFESGGSSSRLGGGGEDELCM